MVQSKAADVAGYLEELSDESRQALTPVLEMVRRAVPAGYREGVAWGQVCWTIPLETYPDTYNGQPLCYVGLAAQKNHCALYLIGPYMDPAQLSAIESAFRESGKKLDMGKSCIRFRKADDLPLDAIGSVIASMPPQQYIAKYEAIRGTTTKKKRPGR